MEWYGLFLAKNIPYRLYISSIIFFLSLVVTVNTIENVGVMLHRTAITSYFKPFASVSILCLHLYSFSTPLGKKLVRHLSFIKNEFNVKLLNRLSAHFFLKFNLDFYFRKGNLGGRIFLTFGFVNN